MKPKHLANSKSAKRKVIHVVPPVLIYYWFIYVHIIQASRTESASVKYLLFPLNFSPTTEHLYLSFNC